MQSPTYANMWGFILNHLTKQQIEQGIKSSTGPDDVLGIKYIYDSFPALYACK
jgi:hypothetical protein